MQTQIRGVHIPRKSRIGPETGVSEHHVMPSRMQQPPGQEHRQPPAHGPPEVPHDRSTGNARHEGQKQQRRLDLETEGPRLDIGTPQPPNQLQGIIGQPRPRPARQTPAGFRRAESPIPEPNQDHHKQQPSRHDPAEKQGGHHHSPHPRFRALHGRVPHRVNRLDSAEGDRRRIRKSSTPCQYPHP